MHNNLELNKLNHYYLFIKERLFNILIKFFHIIIIKFHPLFSIFDLVILIYFLRESYFSNLNYNDFLMVKLSFLNLIFSLRMKSIFSFLPLFTFVIFILRIKYLLLFQETFY